MGTHPVLLTPHEFLNLLVPAQDLGQLANGLAEVSQLHVVSAPLRLTFKGPHRVTIQQQPGHCGTHRVHQAGKRLNLQSQ